ncbi:hypothetical protein ACOMHN_033691 [Nucella lapillus]
MEAVAQLQDDPQDYKTTGVAARVGDLVGLQAMVWSGRPVDVFDNRGWSPLHEAAARGFSGCLEYLLRQQAVDPDWLTHRDETPLLLAARSGHYSCLCALLNAKANVNLRTNEGLSPLYEAIVAQSNECIRLLVKKGAVVNHAVYTGFTPLHQAASMGSAQVAAYLLQQGALQTARCHHGLTPLFLAAQSGSVDTIRILLSRLQESDAPLQSGSVDTVRILLSRLHEVDNASDDVVNMAAEDGATPLLIAAQEGHDDLVGLLLQHGANPNSQVTSLKAGPLQYAVYCQRHKCVRKLLAVTDLLQFDGDFGCMHPLVQALRHADTAILRHLLGAGVDPRGARPLDPEQGEELRDLTEGVVGGDWTAGLLCHLPAQGGLSAARLLLDRGLAPNALTPREVPPLLVAMARTHRPLFRLLLSRGARPNVYNSGQNITMLGALFGDLQGSHVGEVGGPNASGEGGVPNASGEGGPGEPKVLDGVEWAWGQQYRWMEPAKQSFLLPLWAAGGEVETMLRSPVGDGWSLLSVLTLHLASRPLAGRQAAAAALLTLLLGIARGVEILPQDLLALVALDQAQELTAIAEKSGTLAHLCRRLVFRHLCVRKQKVEVAVSAFGLPEQVRDYLLFPGLEPHSHTLNTLFSSMLA